MSLHVPVLIMALNPVVLVCIDPSFFFAQAAFETYHLMSEKWFIHASPTLFHAGTCQPQLSSCFLLTTKEDSIAGIYDTLKQVGGMGWVGRRDEESEGE